MSAPPRKKLLLKVIILGDSGVGKTALLRRYVRGEFAKEHKATIGADFMSKNIKIRDCEVVLQIWDTAGQERFASLGSAFYRGTDAIVLVYDITNRGSFDKIDEWRQEFLRYAQVTDERNFPMVLIGNKTDLGDERAVQYTDGNRYSQNNGLLFFEASAKTGDGVAQAFEEVVSQATEKPDVPTFNPDKIQLDRIDYDREPPRQNGPCACTLI